MSATFSEDERHEKHTKQSAHCIEKYQDASALFSTIPAQRSFIGAARPRMDSCPSMHRPCALKFNNEISSTKFDIKFVNITSQFAFKSRIFIYKIVVVTLIKYYDTDLRVNRIAHCVITTS